MLISLATIDNDLDQSELKFIQKVAYRYNITEEHLLDMIRNPPHLEGLADLPLETKIEYLYNIVSLTLIDGKILPNEILFCQDMATRLGLKRKAVAAMIPLVSDQPYDMVNFTAVRRSISPFL